MRSTQVERTQTFESMFTVTVVTYVVLYVIKEENSWVASRLPFDRIFEERKIIKEIYGNRLTEE